MPNDLLIHASTRRILDAYIAQPPHALLLVGPLGIGKLTLAVHWAKNLDDNPQIVAPDEKGSIGIETIRRLYRDARSKREGQQVIIIDHAEVMSLEAENALLKLLEEPRQGVSFILTATHTESLLPTIVSRTQQVTVRQLGNNDLVQMANKLDPDSRVQALFIAQGRPATLAQLIETPVRFDQEKQFMRQAKQLLTAPSYERYLAISKLTDRATCIATLSAMLQMVSLQIKRSADPKPWLQQATALEHALTQIQSNGNIRAQLLRLFSSY